MLEKYLIAHCAPTLASLKTASMFRIALGSREELEGQLRDWNDKLRKKGLLLMALKQQCDFVLIYVCRVSHLLADLQKPHVMEFLAAYGYESAPLTGVLERLKLRFAQNDAFPHEIGIFLGYPLHDVIGFIHNEGKNCKCAGYWKVYCNECEALRLFAQFQKCREIYAQQWKQGKSIWQLTVAA